MPAELDNMDPEMGADSEMGAEDPGMDAVGTDMGHGDQEGAMAKQELIKLANYATNLQEHIQDDEQLEAWVQSKITIAATNIASVYHYLAYEKKIGEYGEKMDSAELSEGQRRFLKARLVEAKEKMKQLKKAQAEKMAEEKSSTGGEITRTKTGLRHTHDPERFSDEPHGEVASKVKAKSADEKKADKSNDIKLPKHSGNTWGMKGGEKFGKKMEEAKKADKDYDQDGKIESGKDEYLGSKIRAAKKAGKLKEGTCSVCKKDPCVCKKEKKCNECGMYESKCSCDHSVKEAAPRGQKSQDSAIKVAQIGKSKSPGANLKQGAEDALEKGNHKKIDQIHQYATTTTPTGRAKKVSEAKPSAGLSKAKKSAVVKDAKAGKDIGKPGKSFDKVAKAAGGGKKGEKIAAAAMWKNIKETTAYMAEKKNLPGKQEKLDADKDGKLEKSDFAALRAGKKETVKESTEISRLRELTGRLNVNEKTRLNENDEVNNLRRLSNFLKG